MRDLAPHLDPSSGDDLRANAVQLDRLVRLAEREVARRPTHALVIAELAALCATWQHTGWFAATSLEAVVARAAETLKVNGTSGVSEAPQRSFRPIRRVLHVSTFSRSLGGVSNLVPRWIQLDDTRRHDVALARQSYGLLPQRLSSAVAERGGRVALLDVTPAGYRGQARALRRMARDADLVVLHVETDDLLPLLAFQNWSGAPLAFVNHADHAFWAGVAVTDVVVNLRAAGSALTVARRGVPEDRSVVLPTPLDTPGPLPLNRTAAKAALGIDPDAQVLLTIARAPKFDPRGGRHFVEAIAPVLAASPRAHLLAVGPREDESWRRASERFPGRVRRVDETPDTARYLAAADVYVDSFPFTSITSLLEAAARGLPVATFSPWSPASAIFECGAPGLEGVLVLERTAERYAARLTALLADEAGLAHLAARTRESVGGKHTGAGWQAALDEVYEYAAQLPVQHRPFPAPVQSFGEPDTLVSQVFGRDPGLAEHLRLRLGLLAPPSRLAAWRVLRRSGIGGLASLAPDWATAAAYPLVGRLRRAI